MVLVPSVSTGTFFSASVRVAGGLVGTSFAKFTNWKIRFSALDAVYAPAIGKA